MRETLAAITKQAAINTACNELGLTEQEREDIVINTFESTSGIKKLSIYHPDHGYSSQYTYE